jgi:polysaccharide pyruvyl transferase WcaK-like protein
MNYKRKNILFLTTRQWNPGDEFILRGTRNIIRTILPEFNDVIFNRHPEIHPNAKFSNPLRRFQQTIKGHTYWGPFLRVGAKDNSFIAQSTDLNIFSMLVVAGSPGWENPASVSLYKYAVSHSLPAMFLGIGTPYKDFSFDGLPRAAQELLKGALAVTTRDSRLSTALKCVGARQLPCPALLSAATERHVEKVDTLGFAIGHPSTYVQGISREVYKCLVDALQLLKSRYKIKVVCHFYEELPGLQEELGSECEVFYSYNADEYFDVLASCDLVVGTRVHAIGAAASYGIPGVFVAHDQRADTVKGFLADMVDPKAGSDHLVERVEEAICNVSERSLKLLEHKRATLREYQELLATNPEIELTLK